MEPSREKQGELEVQRLKIEKGRITAEGIYIPNALFSFDDDKKSILSYSDMGIFVLLPGSYAGPSVKGKYLPYISNRKTTRTILFQSRNAAAQFVLGENGRTDSWQ